MFTSLLIGLSLTIGQSDAGKPPARSGQLLAPVDQPEKQKDPPDSKPANGKENGNGNGNGDSAEPKRGFFHTIWKTYHDDFFPKKKDDDKSEDEPEAPRRAMPSPWSSPPFPGSEYQGYPLIGVPKNSALDEYPLMKGLYATPWGDTIKDSGVKVYGWVTASGNWSNATNANSPTSYWLKPNSFQLDQLVLRFEREADTVQTDHVDWGFRSTGIYGEDYRYTTAGGWFSNQLIRNNQLYG